MSWGRMRSTGWWPRTKPVPPPTPTPTPTPRPTPVVILDGDDDDGGADDSEVFIIRDAEGIARAAAVCNSKKGSSSGGDVINLDDDDDEEEDKRGRRDGAGPSTVGARSPAATTPPGHAAPMNRYGLNYVSDSEQSDLSEGSDTDSASGLGSGSDGDGSSDCEILPSVAARKMWEEAASRRTVPHVPPRRKDRRASTSASSAESSTHNDENPKDLFASEPPLDDNIWESFMSELDPAGPSSTSGATSGTGPSSVPNVYESPMDDVSNGRKPEDRNPAGSLDPDTAGNNEATHSCKGPVPEKAPETSHPPPADETLSSEGYTGYSFVSKNRVFPACSADWKDNNSRLFVSTPERMDEKIPECSLPLKDLVDDPEKLVQLAIDRDGPDFQDGLIGAREKHKQSDEYKRAQEEEWASRQHQLAIQAEEAKEAKRLRKRKKAEALRLLDMEKRQKQRVEEVRETQRKSEKDIQLKEQCLGAVRLELENIERTCRDVSSILRALGIPVEGGEVKAAYKRAFLKFHPDRVSRTDIYQQVKAEETFKFITRFKEKLKL